VSARAAIASEMSELSNIARMRSPRSTAARIFKAPSSVLAMLVRLSRRLAPPGGRQAQAMVGRASAVVQLVRNVTRSLVRRLVARHYRRADEKISLVPLGGSSRADGGGRGEQVDCRSLTRPRRPLEGIRV